MTSPATSADLASDTPPVRRRTLVVAALSTVVEWYDFTVYLYLATVLSRVFFGGGTGGILAALATFALAYLLRPVGALAFGLVGDRYGRRPVLLISMAVMATATLATAALPTYATAGALATGLLITLRCLMAFSVGGEYTGVMTYLLESSPAPKRGLVTSLAASASEVGALLAVAVSAIIATTLTTDQLDTWGWRIPFLVGGVLAVAVLLARSTLPETPAFTQARISQTGRPGVAQIWRGVVDHKAAVLRTFAISALCSVAYYVGIVYVPTYLSTVRGYSEATALQLGTAAAVIVIAASPVAGWLSDRHGRRPVLTGLAGGSALLSIGLFALLAHAALGFVLVAAMLLAVLAGGLTAVAASAIPEQFRTASRLTGLAIGGTVATTIFGGLAPYATQLIVTTTDWVIAPGILITVVALATLPAIRRSPETAAAHQHDHDPSTPSGEERAGAQRRTTTIENGTP